MTVTEDRPPWVKPPDVCNACWLFECRNCEQSDSCTCRCHRFSRWPAGPGQVRSLPPAGEPLGDSGNPARTRGHAATGRVTAQPNEREAERMRYMAEYLLPGFLFPESTTRELPERSVEAAVAAAPESAYCFTLYETEEPPDLGPDFKVAPVAKNRSPRHYLGGRIYDVAAIEAMGDDMSILAANMRGNDWPEVIQCKPGNWQPFHAGDVLVDV